MAKLPADQVTAILKTISEIKAEEDAAKEEKPPKAKLQTVIVVSDPEGHLAKAGIPELGGYVIQLDRDSHPGVAIDRIKEAALVYNRSPKGKKYPCKTWNEAVHYLTAKHLKDDSRPERRTKVQTKDLTAVIISNNVL
jgi:hypothetical protein